MSFNDSAEGGFKNILGERENAGKHNFLHFPKCFLPFPKQISNLHPHLFLPFAAHVLNSDFTKQQFFGQNQIQSFCRRQIKTVLK